MMEIVNMRMACLSCFPMHPRTAKDFADAGIVADNLHIVASSLLSEFNYLVERSLAVVTDSGGITRRYCDGCALYDVRDKYGAS